MGKAKIVRGIVGVLVAGVVAFGGYTYYEYNKKITAQMEQYLDRDTVFDGISVNGVDISGLSRDAALEKVVKNASLAENAAVSVVVGEKGFSITYDEAEAEYDFVSAVDTAYSIGRNGSVKERYKAVTAAEEKGTDIKAPYSYNLEKVEKFVKEIKAECDCEKEDSVITKVDGRLTVTEDVCGIDVDEALTLEAVCTALEEMSFETLEAVYTKDEPEVTKEHNEKSTALIGTYETTFSRGYVNRNINLKVGCEYINGTVVEPGEEFSMAEGLKEQTYENGYRNAAVYVNGKTEDGMGGGVCQISTTVYNAVIRAELEVTERFNHSLPVSYVPLGLDAAIAEGYKDFKFVNDTDYPVYIEAYIDDNRLIANIYGYEIHDEDREVKFETVYISSVPKPAEKITEDPERAEGEREVTHEGQIGHVVEVYKKVYENDELVSRELFSKSRYMAVADEVTVGTKPADNGESVTVITPTEPVEEENGENATGSEGENEELSENTDYTEEITGETNTEEENNGFEDEPFYGIE